MNTQRRQIHLNNNNNTQQNQSDMMQLDLKENMPLESVQVNQEQKAEEVNIAYFDSYPQEQTTKYQPQEQMKIYDLSRAVAAESEDSNSYKVDIQTQSGTVSLYQPGVSSSAFDLTQTPQDDEINLSANEEELEDIARQLASRNTVHPEGRQIRTNLSKSAKQEDKQENFVIEQTPALKQENNMVFLNSVNQQEPVQNVETEESNVDQLNQRLNQIEALLVELAQQKQAATVEQKDQKAVSAHYNEDYQTQETSCYETLSDVDLLVDHSSLYQQNSENIPLEQTLSSAEEFAYEEKGIYLAQTLQENTQELQMSEEAVAQPKKNNFTLQSPQAEVFYTEEEKTRNEAKISLGGDVVADLSFTQKNQLNLNKPKQNSDIQMEQAIVVEHIENNEQVQQNEKQLIDPKEEHKGASILLTESQMRLKYRAEKQESIIDSYIQIEEPEKTFIPKKKKKKKFSIGKLGKVSEKDAKMLARMDKVELLAQIVGMCAFVGTCLLFSAINIF